MRTIKVFRSILYSMGILDQRFSTILFNTNEILPKVKVSSIREGPIIDDSQQTGLSDLAGSKQVRNTGCQCLQCLQNFRFRKVSLPVHSCGNQEPLVRKFCEQTGLSSRVKYQSSQKFVLRNRRLCRFSLIGHVMMIRTPNYLLNKFMFNVSGG